MNVKLAKRVREAILAQPEKLNMNWFECRLDQALKDLHKDYARPEDDLRYNSCGTVGCIAGHAVFEVDGEGAVADVESRAAMLLKLDKTQAEALFYFAFNDRVDNVFKAERNALRPLSPGTRAYARVVAKAIDKAIVLWGPKP